MKQTDNNDRKSTAKSWLAVLALGLAIFGFIQGIAWLWGDKPDELPDWLLKIYGFNMIKREEPWRWQVLVAVALVILLFILLALILARKRSRHPQEAETRVLVLGSWALYLPAIFGSLPAVFGLVAAMVTPFVAAGLVPIVALFLPHDAADWVSKGIVGNTDVYEYLHRSVIAQPIVAVGLALTIVGFIQIFRAHREKRLQTQGLYATVRHPQHLGIALWAFGLAFAVSCTAGYMMCFTVLYFYVLLALREESLLAQQFGSPYEEYRSTTPFMIPLVKIGLPLPKPGARRTAALIAYYVAGMAILCLIMQAIGVAIAEFP